MLFSWWRKGGNAAANEISYNSRELKGNGYLTTGLVVTHEIKSSCYHTGMAGQLRLSRASHGMIGFFHGSSTEYEKNAFHHDSRSFEACLDASVGVGVGVYIT